MNTSTNTIFTEIGSLLKQFFNNEMAEKLYSLLSETSEISREPYEIDPESKRQINNEMSSGSSLRTQIDKLLSFVEPIVEPKMLIELSLSLAQLLIYSSEYDVAENVIEQLPASEIETNKNQKAESFLLLAKIEWNRSEWKKSYSICKKAYVNFTENENIVGMSKCENLLGNIAGEMGETKKAESHLKKALDYIKYLDMPELKAMISNNLGIVSDLLGDTRNAKYYYNNAVIYYNKVNNKYHEARINHNIGMLNLKQENYENAVRYFDESINISLEKGYLSNCAISFISKAHVYSKLERHDLADIFAEKAMEIASKINDRLSIADVYRVKGMIQQNLNNLTLSEEYFENCLRLNNDFQNKSNITEAESAIQCLQDSM